MLSKNNSEQHCDGRPGEILKMGYLRKLKTMKKKFFVLRAESSEASARLEYYDSEKKFKIQQVPKKSIVLKTCFNINRRRDITKPKHVIALYRRDDCFSIVLENETELQEWLKCLLVLQSGGEDVVDGGVPKPIFEHVWRVMLQEKGLGDSRDLIGPYHVCLTDKALSLVKITNETDDLPKPIDFPLIYIRSCGVTNCFFYIEVGRQTVTGAGALWMLTEDDNIAQNMNSVIYNAFTTQQRDEPHRKRSSSATESSKPTTLLHHQYHSGTKHLSTGYSGTATVVRERSDSMPSRNRTTSETGYMHHTNRMVRPNSIHGRGLNHSPPVGSGPCSTDSAGSSLSIDDGDVCDMATSPRTHGHSTTPDEPAILEENCDEFWNSGGDENEESTTNDYVPMNPSVPITSDPRPYLIDNYKNNNLTSDFIKPSSSCHSRGSSLAEDTPDGYVPMAPAHTDDGYVDMDPVPADYQNSNMSPASSCSITSGTPSTDIRFSEFHLEKVTSYFTPSEEDEDRPHRAYSVGSKPEAFKKKTKLEPVDNGESCRSRALSVGSRVGKWALTKNFIQLARGHAPHGPKSSSAPILSSSCPSKQPVNDRMENHMELDFSHNKSSLRNLDVTDGVTSNSDSGYVDMSCKSIAASPPHPMSASPRSLNASFGKSPPRPLFGRSPPRDKSKPLTISSLFSPPSLNYMDMSRSEHKNRVIISSSTLKTIGEKGDLKPQKFPTTSSANLNISALPNKPFTPDDQSYMDMTPKNNNNNNNKKMTRAKSDKDMKYSPIKKQLDGYMDMSCSAAKLTRKSSDDYMPMNPGGSKPIAIKGQTACERKGSSVTPPKIPPNYLALGNGPSPATSPFSSMRRHPKKRSGRKKTDRRGSKENITTPTGSNSAIFPMSLNSPSSTNSTPTSAETDSPLNEEELNKREHDYMEIDETSTSLLVPLSRVLRISSKDNSPNDSPGDEFGDYATMRPGATLHERKSSVISRKCPPISETATATAATTTATTDPTFAHNSGNSRIPIARRLSSPIPLAKKSTAKQEMQSSSRKPDENIGICRQVSKPDEHSSVCRQVSSSSSSSTEVASVKEENTTNEHVNLIGGGLSRPSSVSSERDITYASLDLAPSGSEGEDGGRSPRTLRTQTSVAESSGSSPSPNPAGGETFTYAEIDFVKTQSHSKKFRH